MLYVHVGLPKTGTTLLQRTLFSKHPEIKFIGKKDVGPLRGHYRDNFMDASSADLFELIMSENDINFPIDKARKLAQNINVEHDPTLVSMEGLSNGRTVSYQEKARRMKIIFKDFKVIFVLRHPVSFLDTLFCIRCNPGNQSYFRKMYNYNKWLFEQLKKINQGWEYNPQLIGKQLNSLKFLDFGERVDFYCQLVGHENVHVLAYEELKINQDKYISKICNILNIDETKGIELTRGKKERVNLKKVKVNMPIYWKVLLQIHMNRQKKLLSPQLFEYLNSFNYWNLFNKV